MGRVLAIMGLLAILGSGAAAAAQTEKPAGDVCTLKVRGMACSACASKVQQTALKLDGVKAAKVSQPNGIAEITYDPAKTNPTAIAKYITDKSGFKPKLRNQRSSTSGLAVRRRQSGSACRRGAGSHLDPQRLCSAVRTGTHSAAAALGAPFVGTPRTH